MAITLTQNDIDKLLSNQIIETSIYRVNLRLDDDVKMFYRNVGMLGQIRRKIDTEVHRSWGFDPLGQTTLLGRYFQKGGKENLSIISRVIQFRLSEHKPFLKQAFATEGSFSSYIAQKIDNYIATYENYLVSFARTAITTEGAGTVDSNFTIDLLLNNKDVGALSDVTIASTINNQLNFRLGMIMAELSAPNRKFTKNGTPKTFNKNDLVVIMPKSTHLWLNTFTDGLFKNESKVNLPQIISWNDTWFGDRNKADGTSTVNTRTMTQGYLSLQKGSLEIKDVDGEVVESTANTFYPSELVINTKGKEDTAWKFYQGGELLGEGILYGKDTTYEGLSDEDYIKPIDSYPKFAKSFKLVSKEAIDIYNALQESGTFYDVSMLRTQTFDTFVFDYKIWEGELYGEVTLNPVTITTEG